MAEQIKKATFSSLEQELQKKITSMENKLRLLELEYLSQQRELQSFLDTESVELQKMRELIEKGATLPKEWLDAFTQEQAKFKEKLEQRLLEAKSSELLKQKYAEKKSIDPRWLYVK